MKSGSSILVLCFLLSVASAQITSTQSLPGHVPPSVAGLTPAGHLEKNRQLKLAIGLPLRNRESLTNLLQKIYDPRGPQYHHYLSPKQFADTFGPTTADYESLKTFARTHGLAITATHSNRMLLDVSGSVSDIETAFHVGFQTYHHPRENRLFYAPDAEPSIALATSILHVGGLDDYVQPRSLLRTKKLQTSFATPAPATGSGPAGSFWGNDFRAAYVPGSPLTGDGQTVGLVEFDGYYPGDISAYASMAGVPSIPLVNIYLDGTDGTPGQHNSEVALDIDMAVCMAPGLSSIIVYEGQTSDDILNQMATDDSASELSSSWAYPIDAVTEQIFLQFAAQGQSMVNSSGDDDAWVGNIDTPCDDPNITSVGGTTLTTSGPGGAWVFETVWNWDLEYGPSEDGSGSGGGISHAYAIPSWQTRVNMTTNQGSTTLRNIPDVAMTADNIFIVADDGQSENVGGTSCAAALFAGFVALANEQAVARGRPPLGFLNPAIYDVGVGANYTNCFHDIIAGNNTWSQSPTLFNAVPGYDLCTGWGTPAGTNLINSLTPDSLQVSPSAGLAFGGGLGGPFFPASQSFSVTNAGVASFDWAIGYDAPWLDISPIVGTIDVGSPAASVTLSVDPSATNLSLGMYGTAVWFTNLTDGVVQSNFVSLAIVQPPVISNQPASLAQLQGTTAVFATVASGGLPLYFQWQLNGTNLANGGRISGAQSVAASLPVGGCVASDIVVSNITAADGGSYTLVVSNAAGTVVSDVATLSLTPSGPIIVQQPASQSVLLGSIVQLSVTVEGDQPVAYQWEQNGIALADGANLSGSATPILTINNASPTNVGDYTVVVTNVLGGAISTNASLAVDVVDNGEWVSADAVPIIVTQPTNQTALFGGAAAFVVVSTGESPLSYQWEFDGYPIVAATNAALILTGVPKTYAGTYSVLVSNLLGSTASSEVQLSVFSGTPESINFDDLPSATTRVPDGYGGLSWSNFSYINAASYPFTGYNAGMVSPPNVAFNSNAAPAAIVSTASFSLISAYLTSAWNDGLQVQVKGYNVSGLVYDNTYSLNATSPTLINFNYIGVNTVQFIASGGSFHLGYNGVGGDYFAMDDVEVSLTTNVASPRPITVSYSFGGFDGGYPTAALAKGVDGNFYGVTQFGGTNGYGSVFEMTTNGLLTTVASLGRFNANPFGGLVQGKDGKLYGTSQFGGTNGDGTVFCITTNGDLTTLASFNLYVNGDEPETTLTQGPDGNLYGTSYFGGTNDAGCVFRVTTNGILTTLASFDISNGIFPLGSLTLASDGSFYGTTLYGGANDVGTVFRLTTNGVLSTVFSFDSSSGGSAPCGTLAQGPDGKFYGVTFYGGTNGIGTAFSVTSEGAFSTLASFDYYVTGGNPETGLIFGNDGNLYGTSCFGGAHNEGAIFSLTTNGVLTALAPFSGTNGVTPEIGAALVQGSDGAFYGTVSYGGAAFNGSPVSGDGVIYRVGAPLASLPAIIEQPSDQYALPGGLVTFNVKAGGAGPLSYSWFRNGVAIPGASGPAFTTNAGSAGVSGQFHCVISNPGASVASSNASLNVVAGSGPLFTFNGVDGGDSFSQLIEGADGKLYGTTFYGGDNADGTVFCIATNGVFNTLISFNYYSTGAYPFNGLIQGSNGVLYGTTAYGGRDGYGTVFSLTTNGIFTTLFSFDSFNGAYPYSGVVIGDDGSFYGTTYLGGASDDGTVFRLTTNGLLTTLASFNFNDGAGPYTPLTKGADGSLYGTSYYGGIYGFGTVFRATTSGALTSLASFAQTNGASPSAAVTQGVDGNLYGVTFSGGKYGAGTVFKLTTNGNLTTLINLDGTNGSNPQGALAQGLDGAFYGTTSEGGPNGDGIAFGITTNGLFARLLTFSGTNGASPGSLTSGPGGAFFGTATFGGAGYDGQLKTGNGTVFRIVPTYFNVGSNQTVIYGTSVVTLAGQVGSLASSYPAVGESVTVTINGVSQSTTINDASGDFSINFNLRGIPVSEAGYTIAYRYAGNASLIPSINSTTTLTLTPLAVTLLGMRAYDGTTVASYAILAVTNAIGTDQVSVVFGSAVLAGMDVGTNLITSPGTLILGGLSAGNYTVNGASGVVVINPLSVTLGGSRPYDQSALVNASQLAIETNYDGTNLNLTGSVTLHGTGAGPEGIANLSGLTLNGPAATNYTLAGAGGTVTITPLALTITLSNASKSYGQTATLNPAAFSVSGTLFGSETVTAVVPVSAGTVATAPVSGSPYPITASSVTGTGGFESANYQITYNPGELTLHHLHTVLTGKRFYDATTNVAASVLIVSNAVGTDQVDFISGSAGLAGAKIGTNTITSLNTLVLGGPAAGNYTLSGAYGAIVIEPLPVTLSGTRPYDGAALINAAQLDIETNYDGTNLNLTGVAALETNAAGLESITNFSALTLTGSAATNYTLDDATGAVTITPLAVTLLGMRAYDGTTVASYAILAVTNAIGTDQVSVVFGSAVLAGMDVGTNLITSPGTLILGGLSAGNYTVNGASGVVVINPLSVTLGGSRPYDQSALVNASQLAIETNYDGTNLNLTGSVTLHGTGAGPENISDLSKLSLNGPASSNYTLAGASGTVTITPLALTITLSNASKSYGQTATLNPTAFSVSGTLFGSETVTAVVPVSAGTVATAPVSGSPYPITASAVTGEGGFESANYQITYNLGELTIHHLHTVLTGKRFYDATTNVAASVLIVSNAVAGDQVDFISGSAGLAGAKIGTNTITSLNTLVLGGPSAGNYTLSGAYGAIVIEPLPVTLNGTRPYDGAALINAAQLSIETNYDGTNLNLSGVAALETNAAGLESITNFSALALSGSAATNYTLDDATGAVTLTPLAVTLLGMRAYDGTTVASYAILAVTNAIGTDQVSVVFGSAVLAGMDVGTNLITSPGTLILGGLSAGNYTVNGASGVVVINPLSVTLGGSRPYDQSALVNASQLAIETNYDGTNLNLTGSVTLHGTGAGPEGIANLSGLTLNGPAATNYTLAGAGGTVTITPLALTITLSNASKSYGQTATLNPAAFSVSGTLFGSETVTAVVPISAGTAATAPVSGSPYPITASAVTGTGGFESANYQITYNPGELTLHHLHTVLTGKRFYDATTNVAASVLIVSNAVAGDQVDFISGSAGLAGAKIGTNTITSLNTLVLGGPAAGNYTLSGAYGAIVIEPLPVTLSGTRPYDGTALINAAQLSIETNYDGTNLNLSGVAALETNAAGPESITNFSALALSGSAATNYTLEGATGTVTLTPLPLTITLSNASKIYGQTANLNPTAFNVSGGLFGSETVTSVVPVSAGTVANAPLSGSPYPITASGAFGSGGFEAANYQITYDPGELTVHHLKVVLSGKRNYDATTNAAASVLTVSNLVAGDQVNLVAGSAGLAGSKIGTNAITSLTTNLALSGPAAANYILNSANGAVVIEPLPVSLSGTRPYDGTILINASQLSIETNYDGTNLSLTGSAMLGADAVGPENITNFYDLTLAGPAATNYTLTGANGVVTITNPHAPFAATAVNVTGTGVVVCWESVPGVLYELVTTTNLSPPLVWEVTGDPITAADTNTCVTLPDNVTSNTVTLVLIREITSADDSSKGGGR